MRGKNKGVASAGKERRFPLPLIPLNTANVPLLRLPISVDQREGSAAHPACHPPPSAPSLLLSSAVLPCHPALPSCIATLLCHPAMSPYPATLPFHTATLSSHPVILPLAPCHLVLTTLPCSPFHPALANLPLLPCLSTPLPMVLCSLNPALPLPTCPCHPANISLLPCLYSPFHYPCHNVPATLFFILFLNLLNTIVTRAYVTEMHTGATRRYSICPRLDPASLLFPLSLSVPCRVSCSLLPCSRYPALPPVSLPLSVILPLSLLMLLLPSASRFPFPGVFTLPYSTPYPAICLCPCCSSLPTSLPCPCCLVSVFLLPRALSCFPVIMLLLLLFLLSCSSPVNMILLPSPVPLPHPFPIRRQTESDSFRSLLTVKGNG